MYKIFRRYLSIEVLFIFAFIFAMMGMVFSSYCKKEGVELLEMRMNYVLRNFYAMKFKIREIYQDFQIDTSEHLSFLVNVFEKSSEKDLKKASVLKKEISVLDFEEVFIVNDKGIITSSSDETLKGTLIDDYILEYASDYLFSEDSEKFFLKNWGNLDFLAYEKSKVKNQNKKGNLYFLKQPYKDGFIYVGRPLDILLEQIEIERKRGFVDGVKIAETGFILYVGGKSGRILASTYPQFEGKFPRELGLNIEKMNPKGVFVAYLSDYGKVLGYRLDTDSSTGSTLVGIYPFEEMYEQRNSVLKLCGILFLLMYIICLLSVSHLLKRVVVSGIVRTNDTLAKITQGDLQQRVDVDSNPELKMLSDGINQMVESLKQMMIDKKHQIQREFDFAREIQANVLPSVQSLTDKETDFSLAVTIRPALEIGGDFYDIFFIGKNRDKLCYVIADVSDKGIPAALFMMSAKMLIKNLILSGLSPAETLNRANIELSEKNTTFTFVTVFVAVVDLLNGHVVFANAGHNLPFLHLADGSCIELPCNSGPILGVIKNVTYVDNEANYRYNEGLFLYTDGVTEALNKKGEIFGVKRLSRILNANSDTRPTEIIKIVDSEIQKFSKGTSQSDDITMLVLLYNVKSLELPAVMENNGKFFDFVDQILEENHCPVSIASQIDIVLDEIISNIVNYAYVGTNKEPKLKICCSVDDEGKMVTLRFIDSGKQFNPLEAEDPDINLPLNERKIGKLGLFIVKQFMTNIVYTYEDGHNILSMQKSLQVEEE